MQFYRLQPPDYLTDQEDDAANPIRMERELWLPGMMCNACGETWAGSRRLYIDITEPDLRRQLRGGPLPAAQWNLLAERVRHVVASEHSEAFEPGDVFGQPRAILTRRQFPELIHPLPGQLIVSHRVATLVEDHRITGVRVIPVRSEWAPSVRRSSEPPPPQYELMILGKAWRRGSTEETIRACDVCQRRILPNPEVLNVDQSRWDGSDMFHLDRATTMVFVTENVKVLLETAGVQNYRCEPIDASLG
jgi:hypothetical protein